jgi:hypothetical protein
VEVLAVALVFLVLLLGLAVLQQAGHRRQLEQQNRYLWVENQLLRTQVMADGNSGTGCGILLLVGLLIGLGIVVLPALG